MILKSRRRLRAVTAPDATAASMGQSLIPQPQLASPFTTTVSSLSTIVWSDLLGQESMPVTRAEAMAVPAVAKARHVVAPKVAEYPLRVWRGETQLEDNTQPWMYRSDDGVPTFHRMLWTVDDLIFTGWSLWRARWGAPVIDESGARRPLLGAYRVGRDRWCFNAWTQVVVDNVVVDPQDFILIPGPHEGICQFGRTTIRQATDLLSAAANAAHNPSAHTELHQTEGLPMTEPDVKELLSQYNESRRNGGASYTPPNIEVKDHGAVEAQLLIEGRNAASVDCARLVGVGAAMVDATVVHSSLEYVTQEGRGLEHTEYGVEPYMASIAARLSMDDVVPRGQRIEFDRGQDIGPVSPSGPITED